MDADLFYLTLAENRYLEPEQTKKATHICSRCGRLLSGREAWANGDMVLCGDCVKMESGEVKLWRRV